MFYDVFSFALISTNIQEMQTLKDDMTTLCGTHTLPQGRKFRPLPKQKKTSIAKGV